MAERVKNPSAMWETWVHFLGWEDPPENGTATHSSILAWRIPWTIRIGHNGTTFTFQNNVYYIHIIYIMLYYIILYYIYSVQFSSVAQSCLTLCDPMNHSTPGRPVHHTSRSSLKLMSIELVMPSRHFILRHLLLLLPPFPPSISLFQ